jgi:hypothetical protein
LSETRLLSELPFFATHRIACCKNKKNFLRHLVFLEKSAAYWKAIKRQTNGRRTCGDLHLDLHISNIFFAHNFSKILKSQVWSKNIFRDITSSLQLALSVGNFRKLVREHITHIINHVCMHKINAFNPFYFHLVITSTHTWSTSSDEIIEMERRSKRVSELVKMKIFFSIFHTFLIYACVNRVFERSDR